MRRPADWQKLRPGRNHSGRKGEAARWGSCSFQLTLWRQYSPPEEFLIPIDHAPDLAASAAPMALALGASAWARYQPDRFDIYSAGVVFMQLCLPALRSDRGLKAFNESLRATPGHSLDAWRVEAALSPAASTVLDASDGAGWALAGALLKARPDDWTQPRLLGSFGADGRPSAEAALAYRFFSAPPRRLTASAPQRRLAQLSAAVEAQGREVSATLRKLRSLQEDQALLVTSAPAAEQLEPGLEGLFSRVRRGIEMLLDAGQASAASRFSSVRLEVEEEGPPEDTPPRPRAATPRDPTAAAAAAASALMALRERAAGEGKASDSPAVKPPPESAAALAEELEAVSQRLVSMQARMSRLLAENDRVLKTLEKEREMSAGRKEAVAAAAAAVAAATRAVTQARDAA